MASMSQPVPSSQRSLPLVARADLEPRAIHFQDEQYWVLKDPLRLEYFQLQLEQYAVFELLDGRRSAEDIRTELRRRFPSVRPSLAQIHGFIFDLYDKGLIWSTRPGRDKALAKAADAGRSRKWRAAMQNVLFIRLPGWDPEWLIRRIYPVSRWVFHPLVVLLALTLMALAWGLTIFQFNAFQQRLPDLTDFLTWQSVLVVWITLGVAKVLHELAHALACHRFGGECHEIGLAFLVFSPCLYCDVSDSWLLPSKWKRMAVAAAGIYIELAMSAVALLLWWRASGGMFSQVLLSVFLVTNVSVVLFNLNPLLRLDGYYLLSDWLEIPNLRRKSEAILHSWLAWCFLGVRVRPDPFLPRNGRTWFALFAVCSAIYRWLLVLVVSFVLYRALEPYQLHYLGLLVGAGVSMMAVLMTANRFVRFVQAHGDQMRKSHRPAATAVFVAIVFAAAMFAPIPVQVDAPFVVEPQGMRKIYASIPGRVVAVHVKPGDAVRKNQVLVELVDPQRLARFRKLRTTFDLQAVEVRIHQASGDATQEALASQSLKAIAEEIAAVELELRGLTIVAPCDGRVIAAPAVAARSSRSASDSLPGWNGTPLDTTNSGCLLAAGAHILSISPETGYEAVLLVDQFDRLDFALAQPARLKIEHLPYETIHGAIGSIAPSIMEISARGSEEDNSLDLQAAAKTNLAPQTKSAYRATVPIPAEHDRLLPGMRGRAKVCVAKRSAAALLWRYARDTFQFVL